MKNYSIKIALTSSKGTIAYHNGLISIDAAIQYLEHLRAKYQLTKDTDLTNVHVDELEYNNQTYVKKS